MGFLFMELRVYGFRSLWVLGFRDNGFLCLCICVLGIWVSGFLGVWFWVYGLWFLGFGVLGYVLGLTGFQGAKRPWLVPRREPRPAVHSNE